MSKIFFIKFYYIKCEKSKMRPILCAHCNFSAPSGDQNPPIRANAPMLVTLLSDCWQIVFVRTPETCHGTEKSLPKLHLDHYLNAPYFAKKTLWKCARAGSRCAIFARLCKIWQPWANKPEIREKEMSQVFISWCPPTRIGHNIWRGRPPYLLFAMKHRIEVSSFS